MPDPLPVRRCDRCKHFPGNYHARAKQAVCVDCARLLDPKALPFDEAYAPNWEPQETKGA